MQEIKLYRELTAIETKDGILYTTATPDELDILVSKNDFLNIGGERINKYQIKRYGVRKVDSIQGHILTKDRDTQEFLRKREKEKTEKVGRGFDSIKEIENFLSNKGLR